MIKKFTFSNSYIESIEGIDYLSLNEENHYKTGFAAGTLFIRSKNQLIFFFKSSLVKIIVSILCFFKKKKLFKITVPPQYLEELKGFSEATGINYKHLLLANLIYEIGCSAFAYLNSDGSLLVGHNTDTMKWLANFLLRKTRPLVVSISIPGKNSFTHISLPGFFGAANGFNDKGIAISSHDAGDLYSKIVPDNIAAASLLRMLLEEAESLDEVSNIAVRHPVYYPGICLVASEREQKFGILEMYPSDMNFIFITGEKYAYTANHYHSTKMQKYHKIIKAGSLKRFEYLGECFVNRNSLNIDEATTILKDTRHGTKWDTTGHSVTNEGTFQSFILDVKNRNIYISNGNKVPVSLHGDYVKIETK